MSGVPVCFGLGKLAVSGNPFFSTDETVTFHSLASNHRSTDTGSVGPASIANTIASTTDSRGAPCSALRLWNSHNYRVLCLQVQVFVGKDKP